MNSQHLRREAPAKSVNQPTQSRISVSDRIFRVQRDNSVVTIEKTGPVVDLFFHELKPDKSTGRTVINYTVAVLGFLLLALLYPLIAVCIKLSTSDPILQKIKTEGKSGNIFSRYEFTTQHNQGNEFSTQPARKEYFTLGKILARTGLHKLPAVINIFKGQMNAVGPAALDQAESTYWNNIFDDYYKRHAVRPGLIAVYKSEHPITTFSDVHKQLHKEFRYITRPTLNKDLKILLGLY